jgi:hypothetical protein
MANASPPVQTGRPPSGPAEPGRDWAAEAADRIERVVGTVRDNTSTRAFTVARAIVYALFGAIVSFALVIFVIIAAGRFLNVVLPDSWFGEDHMWAVYFLVGLVFVILGTLLWSFRRRSAGR